jgi:hypothetical protein
MVLALGWVLAFLGLASVEDRQLILLRSPKS